MHVLFHKGVDDEVENSDSAVEKHEVYHKGSLELVVEALPELPEGKRGKPVSSSPVAPIATLYI